MKEEEFVKISIAPGEILQRYGITDGIKLLSECSFDALDLDLGWMQPWGCLDSQEPNHWEMISEDELLEVKRPYKEVCRSVRNVINLSRKSRDLRLLPCHRFTIPLTKIQKMLLAFSAQIAYNSTKHSG